MAAKTEHEKKIKEIIPNNLKTSKEADTWRIGFCPDCKSLHIDFGKYTKENEITVISRNTIQKNDVERFVLSLLKTIYDYNKRMDLNIDLFSNIEVSISNEKKEE